jgi:hypothetical protein
MNITVTPAILAELQSTVDDIGSMLLEERNSYECERCERKEPHGNTARSAARYYIRRGRLIAHREKLRVLYISITGEDPWDEIPF